MNRNNGNVINPREATIEVQQIDTAEPVAFPTSFQFITAAGQKHFVVGGMTKLEYAAFQIAAGLGSTFNAEQAADEAVKRAFAVLQKCEKLQAELRTRAQ